MGEKTIKMLAKAGPQLATIIIVGIITHGLLATGTLSALMSILAFCLAILVILVVYFVPPSNAIPRNRDRTSSDVSEVGE